MNKNIKSVYTHETLGIQSCILLTDRKVFIMLLDDLRVEEYVLFRMKLIIVTNRPLHGYRLLISNIIEQKPGTLGKHVAVCQAIRGSTACDNMY